MAVVWNGLDKGASITLSNYSLTAANATTAWESVRATLGRLTGKYYFEVRANYSSSSRAVLMGVVSADVPASSHFGGNECWTIQVNNAVTYKRNNNVPVEITGIAPPANGDVHQFALSMTEKKIWFGRNGVWFDGGNPATGANPAYLMSRRILYPGVSIYTPNDTLTAAFSADQWVYPAPAGFAAIDAPQNEVMPGRAVHRMIHHHRFDSGPYQIIEPVTRLNAVPPQPIRVRLCDLITGRVAREGWSDPVTGLIAFTWIRLGPWILYAMDHTGEFQAVIIANRLATLTGARP